MEEIPKSRILEFRPDTLVEVRKSVGLDDPSRMNEAIDILEDWVRKQAHFTKKDFSRTYLERLLITSKGFIERAKQKIDRLCTYKTLMPEFFKITDLKKDIAPIKNKALMAVLPKLTKDNCRVYICRVTSDFDADDVLMYFNYSIMSRLRESKKTGSSIFLLDYLYCDPQDACQAWGLWLSPHLRGWPLFSSGSLSVDSDDNDDVLCEYMMQNEYCSGFIIIADYRGLNAMNLVTKFNPMILSRIKSIFLDGYGLRLKGLLAVSESKAIETLLSFFKQFVKAKLANRLQAIDSNESLYELVPPEILPVEYGGEERSLKTLHDEWLEVLGSPENTASYLEMSKAATDESCRQKDAFHEQYLGTPGSFRTLSVD